MWTCIIFITLLNAGISEVQVLEIGTYKNDKDCVKTAKNWIKKHIKPRIEMDFTCEKQI